MSDVFSFSEEETRRDSLERARLELQVWRQKILLITDQVIYEVWGSILQEPVVRQAALTLEKCLLRVSSLGDKQRSQERRNMSQTKKQKVNRSCLEALASWVIVCPMEGPWRNGSSLSYGAKGGERSFALSQSFSDCKK